MLNASSSAYKEMLAVILIVAKHLPGSGNLRTVISVLFNVSVPTILKIEKEKEN